MHKEHLNLFEIHNQFYSMQHHKKGIKNNYNKMQVSMNFVIQYSCFLIYLMQHVEKEYQK